jgi:CDP-diglyceride synthetase
MIANSSVEFDPQWFAYRAISKDIRQRLNGHGGLLSEMDGITSISIIAGFMEYLFIIAEI